MNIEALIGAMARDKKALTSLTFVLDGATGLEVVTGVSEGAIRGAYADLEARLS
jgi:hypothetical protein